MVKRPSTAREQSGDDIFSSQNAGERSLTDAKKVRVIPLEIPRKMIAIAGMRTKYLKNSRERAVRIR